MGATGAESDGTVSQQLGAESDGTVWVGRSSMLCATGAEGIVSVERRSSCECGTVIFHLSLPGAVM